jgi:hypothetical protein
MTALFAQAPLALLGSPRLMNFAHPLLGHNLRPHRRNEAKPGIFHIELTRTRLVQRLHHARDEVRQTALGDLGASPERSIERGLEQPSLSNRPQCVGQIVPQSGGLIGHAVLNLNRSHLPRLHAPRGDAELRLDEAFGAIERRLFAQQVRFLPKRLCSVFADVCNHKGLCTWHRG